MSPPRHSDFQPGDFVEVSFPDGVRMEARVVEVHLKPARIETTLGTFRWLHNRWIIDRSDPLFVDARAGLHRTGAKIIELWRAA